MTVLGAACAVVIAILNLTNTTAIDPAWGYGAVSAGIVADAVFGKRL